MIKSFHPESPGKPPNWNQAIWPGQFWSIYPLTQHIAVGPLLCGEYYPRCWAYHRECDSQVLLIKVLTSLKWSLEEFKETNSTQIITNCDKPKDLWIGIFMALIFLWGYSAKITNKQTKAGIRDFTAGIMLYGLDYLFARLKNEWNHPVS